MPGELLTGAKVYLDWSDPSHGTAEKASFVASFTHVHEPVPSPRRAAVPVPAEAGRAGTPIAGGM